MQGTSSGIWSPFGVSGDVRIIIHETLIAVGRVWFWYVRRTHVRLFATLQTVARQAPLSMGFSRQEYWSGLPCPPSGDLPHTGIKPTSLASLALAGGFFPTGATGKPLEYPCPSIILYINLWICFIIQTWSAPWGETGAWIISVTIEKKVKVLRKATKIMKGLEIKLR